MRALLIAVSVMVTFGAIGCFLLLAPAKFSVEHADYSQARSAVPDLYLPKEAVDIYAFEEVGGLQSLEKLYRFTVLNSELGNSIDEMLKQVGVVQRKEANSADFQKRPLSAEVSTWPSWASEKLHWWKPDEIATGYSIQSNEAYGLKMWIDTERSTVFVYQSD